MRNYLLQKPLLFAVSLFVTVIEAALTIGIAFILSSMINAAVEKEFAALKIHIVIALGYLLFQMLLGMAGNYTKTACIGGVEKAYRRDLFRAILRQQPKDYYATKQGEYLAIISNDADDVLDQYVASVFTITGTVTAGVLAVLSIIAIDWRILLLSLGIGLVYSVLTQKIGARLQTDKDLCYKAMHGLMVRVKELFAGYLLFQNKEMQQYAEDSFTQANGDFVEKKVRFGFHFANTTLLNQLLGQSFVVMIVAVAAYFVFVDHLTVGDLVAIAQLMTTMIAPLEELSEILNNRQASKNLWLRQKRYLTHLNKRDDLGRVKHDFKQAIVFDNVSYTLDDVSVLNAISLIVERGKKYAIVGDSGSGKSTVCRLLQKLGEPTSGECTIDGESYSVISDRGLAPLFSYVAQEVFLFEGSIRDNICLFQAISEDTLTSIVKQTGLDAVLARKEATLDTPIFENGLNLSGGERQRIALARALAQDAPILILDEATSALDKTSALSVMQAVLQDPNRTVLSVTHHLAEEELRYYDELWLFHQGKITQQVDLHTHEKSTYPQLAG